MIIGHARQIRGCDLLVGTTFTFFENDPIEDVMMVIETYDDIGPKYIRLLSCEEDYLYGDPVVFIRQVKLEYA